MTTAEQLYEIQEGMATGRRILSTYAGGSLPGFHIAAAAGPRDSEDGDRWWVMLGFDAAEAIGEGTRAALDVRSEAEARQWLDLLTRLYLATPDITSR